MSEKHVTIKISALSDFDSIIAQHPELPHAPVQEVARWIMNFHVFLYDYDFPGHPHESYEGVFYAFDEIKEHIQKREDLTRDCAVVYAEATPGLPLIKVALWYDGGGLTDMDSDGWLRYRSDLMGKD